MFYVYVIKSQSSGKMYIGHTDSLNERVSQHNHGYTQATKSVKDWKLIHSEEYFSRSLAVRRERFLKTGNGRKALVLKGII